MISRSLYLPTSASRSFAGKLVRPFESVCCSTTPLNTNLPLVPTDQQLISTLIRLFPLLTTQTENMGGKIRGQERVPTIRELGDGATGRRGDGATGRRGVGATGRRGDGA